MRVGFAGLGRMGVHMATNLAHAGHELIVWNRNADKAEMLAQTVGGAWARTPADLAARAEIIVTMLADDAASESVHLGPDGLFSGSGNRLFIEMGTMSPAHIASLARHAPDGGRVIDAPVSGATQAAQDAQLLIMVGATEDEAAPARPLFAAMGRKTLYLGEPGSGAVMKLAVNALIHGLNQTLAEAMTLAEASGIDPTLAYDVIENSAAAAPMLKYRRPLYLDEAAHDVTFSVALARKDMEITTALARDLGVTMPQGHATLRTLLDAEASGYGARDMASILNFMREEKS